jgi:hypothetical protein
MLVLVLWMFEWGHGQEPIFDRNALYTRKLHLGEKQRRSVYDGKMLILRFLMSLFDLRFDQR